MHTLYDLRPRARKRKIFHFQIKQLSTLSEGKKNYERYITFDQLIETIRVAITQKETVNFAKIAKINTNKDYTTNLNVLSTIQRRKQSRVTSITPRSYGSDQLRVKEPKINDTFCE